METENRLCGSCEHYGVTTIMNKVIWVEYNDDNDEIWGYEYICPICGRNDGH